MNIEAFRIEAFLNEIGYHLDPDNQKLSTTKYSKKGEESIFVPNKLSFTSSEIVGFMPPHVYNQLVRFTSNNYWK